jgi:hypothetical protein
MDAVRFSTEGYVVHRPNPDIDPNYDQRGALGSDAAEFQGRRPVIVQGRDVYVGDQNWYHGDVASHHGIREDLFADPHGYFGGGKHWGNGALAWYGATKPSDHPGIASALQQAGYPIPNHSETTPPKDHFDDADWGDMDLSLDGLDDEWQ